MAKRNVEPILAEMVAALERIAAATAGKTREDFRDDWLLRHGVERGLEIISEAARHLPDELLKEAPETPWKQIRGIGNVLRHEYHKISEAIVWTVVEDHLPPLHDAIDRLVRSSRSPSDRRT